MNEMKLRGLDWRFRYFASPYKCPQCGGETLRDEYPPNYGSGQYGNEGSSSIASIKHVCVTDKIQFRVNKFELTGKEADEAKVTGVTITGVGTINNTPFLEGYSVIQIENLQERDGMLITKADAEDYRYFDEHGVFPVRTWG